MSAVNLWVMLIILFILKVLSIRDKEINSWVLLLLSPPFGLPEQFVFCDLCLQTLSAKKSVKILGESRLHDLSFPARFTLIDILVWEI